MATPRNPASGEPGARPHVRSPSIEPGEIPVASYSSQASQASGETSGEPPKLPAGFSQTQASSALTSSPAASQDSTMNANNVDGVQIDRNDLDLGGESLPLSSAVGSFSAPQQSSPSPSLAQAGLPWSEIAFQATEPPPAPLRWKPIITPVHMENSYSQNAESAQAPAMSYGRYAQDSTTSSGWKVVTRRKRTRVESPHPSYRDQRRKVDEMEMHAALRDHIPGPGMPNPPFPDETSNFFGVGPSTGGRMGPPLQNPFEVALQSNSAFPSMSPSTIQRPQTHARTPPSPPLSDSDYLNLDDLGTQLVPGGVSAIPVPTSAPDSEHMLVDPASYAVQPLDESSAVSRGMRSASTVNVPLRTFGASGTFAHQFAIQTPRQQYDVFNPAPAKLPQRQPQPPPYAGAYVLRDVPPHRDHRLTPGVQTEPRPGRPARASRALRTLHEEPAQTASFGYAERVPVGRERISEGEEPLPAENQENLAPAFAIRGNSRRGSHFEDQVNDDFRQLAASRADMAVGAPYQSTPLPPVNPLTGRVSKVGQRQSSIPARYPEPAMPQCILYPRMQAPEGGYPRVRFSDPDSVVVGTDEAILADMRNEEANGPVLGIRVARVNGVPPDRLARLICSWVEAVTTDITGETGVTCVPPRPPHLNRQGDPNPFVWFLCDLSKEGAETMLDVGVVSCPTITFFIHPLTVKPDLVVVLTGFVSTAALQIEAMIRNIFEGPAMRAIIDQFVPTNPIFRNNNIPTEMATQFVLETLEVELDTLGGDVPCAKVYIQSPAGTTEGWRRFREAVARIPFEDRYNPRASTRTFSCDICGGNDHSMQMCRYPALPGWKGPVPIPEPVHDEPAPMGSDLVFAPRPAGGNQQKKPAGGKGGGFYAQPGPPFGGQNFGGGGRNGGGRGGFGQQGTRPF